MDSPAFTEN